MQDAPTITPPSPTIRFSMRTMLAITAIAAVVAAVAAAFWKRQTPEAQWDLLAFWGALLVGVGPVAWYSWREVSRHRLDAGPILFTLQSKSRFRLVNLINRSQFVRLSGFALPFLSFIVLHSQTISNKGVRFSSMPMAALLGLMTSLMAGIPLQFMLRQQISLGANGILWGAGIVPWKHIRHAEWLRDRPHMMKLRRRDGDVYLDVPEGVRDGVEALVRSKTEFVGDGATGSSAESCELAT